MLSLKAQWLNPPNGTNPDVIKEIETKYARWIKVLADDNLEILRDAFNIASRHHWEYQVWNGKALHGIRPELNKHAGRQPKFNLQFEDVEPNMVQSL